MLRLRQKKKEALAFRSRLFNFRIKTMPTFGYGKPMTEDQICHYRQVKKERRKQGLPVETEKRTWDRRNGETHELHGKRFRKIETGKEYEVEVVGLYWRDGWYIDLIMVQDETKSHGRWTYRNIDSESPYITSKEGKFEIIFEEIK